MEEKILLTGGTGKLGQAIQKSELFPSLLAPPREALDITKPESIRSFFFDNDIRAIIHCAALARMGECEKCPGKALETNTIGTGNLVKSALGKNIRFVHVSTDGVYPGTRGGYSEKDVTIPYNMYGWTKLGAESAVKLLPNHCIIRTSFFDPENIPYEDSPTDMFSSKLPISRLVEIIAFMISHGFVGTVNVGGERKSDFERYKEFKPGLKPCAYSDIVRRVPFPIARDASMDCSLLRKIRGGEK